MNISVIITCHNEEKFIERCLRSVLNQTIFDSILEVIVVNDSSTDDSQKILDKIFLECSKIKIIKSSKKSISNSRNKAINLVRGQYIAFLDGDDYWLNNKLENQVNQFAKLDNDFGLIYTNVVEISEENNSKKIHVRNLNDKKNQLLDYFLNDAPIFPSTILIKSSVINHIGKFDENIKYYEDTDFNLRILEKYKAYYLDDFSCFKQKHVNQVTNNLFDLIIYGDLVIDKASKRNKNLFKLKRLRFARNRNKALIECIVKSYNKRIILRLIFQSLRYNFINITPWLAFILLMFPSEYNKKFIQFLKKNKNDK